MRAKVLLFAVSVVMFLMLACGEVTDYGPDGYRPPNTPSPKPTAVIIIEK